MLSFEAPQIAAGTGYRNPVYPGDFPDPSIIRVGERTFYAVTTSTDWAPFFPIFRSTDLVTWTIVGHVFAERPAWCAGNFWAPDFAQKDGRFFVYYTARRKDGGLCVAVAVADRPEGPYVDHGPLVGQTNGSIDAMACDDEHGARWLLWKEDGNAYGRPTPLWAQRLDDAGVRLTGEIVELFRNDQPWEGRLVEAPHVIRRDGWFYLFYSGNACCGEDCAYAVGVARARALTGPWEKCPRNPILATNDAFRCPGHGAPVDTGDGRWYYLYHAYEQRPDAIYVGRQLCLDEITWDADGWPAINGGAGPSRLAPRPFAGSPAQVRRAVWTSDFSRGLDRGWQWPQSNAPALRGDRGGIVVAVARPRKSGDPLAAVLARPTTGGDYAAEAIVDRRGVAAGTLASLCVYGTNRDAMGIGVCDSSVVVWRKRGGRFVELARARVRGDAMHLRVTAIDGRAYRFAFSADGRNWSTLGGRMDGKWLPPWDAGVRIALAVGGEEGAGARFTALRVTPTPAHVTEIGTRTKRREKFTRLVARGLGAGRQSLADSV